MEYDDNKIKASMNLAKLPTDKMTKFVLSKNTDWAEELLAELNENVASRSPEDYIANSDIEITIEICKRYKGSVGEYVLCKGQISATYFTECVKSLKEMQDSVECEFTACYIDYALEGSPEYAEQVEIFMDGSVWDLHFYENRKVDLKEMIHENLYLNINAYPSVEDADSPSEDNDGGETLH